MRAVLDPNVVISGLLSGNGSPAQLLRAWQDGRFELVISPLLCEELERALGYPKLRDRISQRDAEVAFGWLKQGATLVNDPPEEPPVRSEDPGDDYLIALAASESAALVSGDKHLLALAVRIPVCAPRRFVELL